MKAYAQKNPHSYTNHAINTMAEASSLEKKAQNVIQALTKPFINEAETTLNKMEKILSDIDFLQQKEKDRLIKGLFFQMAHDLKGQGATYGFPLITRLSAHICTLINEEKSYSVQTIKIFKSDIDDMQKIIKYPPNEPDLKLTKKIINRLECKSE